MQGNENCPAGHAFYEVVAVEVNPESTLYKDCKGVKRCKRCRATAMRATPTRRDEQDGGEKEGEGDGNDEPGREHDGDVEGKKEVVTRTNTATETPRSTATT